MEGTYPSESEKPHFSTTVPLCTLYLFIRASFSTSLHTVLQPSPMKYSMQPLQYTLLGSMNLDVFPGGAVVKNLPANAGDARDVGSIPGLGRAPEVGNGNPLCILAWEIPWTEESGGLQSVGLQKSRMQLSTSKKYELNSHAMSLGRDSEGWVQRVETPLERLIGAFPMSNFKNL